MKRTEINVKQYMGVSAIEPVTHLSADTLEDSQGNVTLRVQANVDGEPQTASITNFNVTLMQYHMRVLFNNIKRAVFRKDWYLNVCLNNAATPEQINVMYEAMLGCAPKASEDLKHDEGKVTRLIGFVEYYVEGEGDNTLLRPVNGCIMDALAYSIMPDFLEPPLEGSPDFYDLACGMRDDDQVSNVEATRNVVHGYYAPMLGNDFWSYVQRASLLVGSSMYRSYIEDCKRRYFAEHGSMEGYEGAEFSAHDVISFAYYQYMLNGGVNVPMEHIAIDFYGEASELLFKLFVGYQGLLDIFDNRSSVTCDGKSCADIHLALLYGYRFLKFLECSGATQSELDDFDEMYHVMVKAKQVVLEPLPEPFERDVPKEGDRYRKLLMGMMYDARGYVMTLRDVDVPKPPTLGASVQESLPDVVTYLDQLCQLMGKPHVKPEAYTKH